ncbi:MAG: DUF3857 domain-containing protein, partial [Verrucomicrobiae bacterium]|nr:DUF3857 domain-containing protein [Verrucomicrobiae bacterium]
MKQTFKLGCLRIARAFAAVTWLVFRLGAQSGVSVAPPPDWVRETDWTPARPPASQTDPKGKRYLLYEVQERPRQAEEFSRVVVQMINEAGVQDSGSLRFDFDPHFQEILLHRVLVHRDGLSRSRLDLEKVRVIQPESELDDHLITGRKDAVVIVDDLRVGDILEYTYTVRGTNPVLAGHYASRFQVQSETPVDRELFRVVWDGPGELRRRSHQVRVQPTVSPWPGGADYVWSFSQLATIPAEDLQPAGFEPFPYLEVSDFAGWDEVVDWALPLYALSDSDLPQPVRELATRWRAAGGSAEEQARQAVQFVQDDLRYTALELGPDSYRPAPPLETLEKRYGDCKGKVVLLRLLLHALGIESQPALVNSAIHDGIARRLPSPFAFDHVILRILLDGRVVWVDPTLSHQGGTLWERYLPPYGKALVIQPGSRLLEDLPQSSAELAFPQSVTSTLRITDYAAPAAFTVQTAFQGANADHMRERLARTDRVELAERYLNYYAHSYPEIGATGPVQVSDDRVRNHLRVEESYWITNLWRPAESSGRLEATFFADNLSDVLPDPETRIRKTPLRLTYPMRRQQEIRVHLPDADWQIPDAELAVEHEGFSFQYRRRFSDSTVQF